MKTVQAIGWDWVTDGVVVTLLVDGSVAQWFVPIGHVHIQFSREMARVGAPFLPSVGAPSVGGLFGSISHAFRSASRAVKHAVPKAVTRAANSVAHIAEQGAKQVSRRVKHYGRQAYDVAKQAVHDPRQLALMVATGGASALAQTDAARDLLRGAKYVPGPIGTLAGAGLAANRQLSNVAQGKRVNFGQLAGGLAEAGAAYIPGGAALSSTPLGRAALSTGLGLAKGQRVDRALKSAVLKEANIPGLGDHLPSSSALNAAHKAWGVISQGHEAAKRIHHGRPHKHDHHKVRRAHQAKQHVKRTAHHARHGHPRARELMRALHRVGKHL